jgi:hypothetical protein
MCHALVQWAEEPSDNRGKHTGGGEGAEGNLQHHPHTLSRFLVAATAMVITYQIRALTPTQATEAASLEKETAAGATASTTSTLLLAKAAPAFQQYLRVTSPT